jgi:hypothetical protein
MPISVADSGDRQMARTYAPDEPVARLATMPKLRRAPGSPMLKLWPPISSALCRTIHARCLAVAQLALRALPA